MPNRTRFTGNLVSDNNIFSDIVNDRVGIGSTVPTAKLDVLGNVNVSGVITASSFSGTATTATNVIGGIGSITSLTVSGISTLGVVTSGNIFSTGIITATTFIGSLNGNATTSGYATTSGISTVSQGLTGTPNIVVGIATASSFVGPLSGTATTATNLADAANITTGTINSARLSGTYDINVSYANTAGISTTSQGLTGTPNISISNLNASGITTLGTVQISSGIITSTSGVVTYYGDGSKLTGVIASSSGVTVQNNGSPLGTATTINFSTNLTATFSSGIATITGSAGSSLSISTNTTNTNQLIPYVTSFGSTTGLGATNNFVFNPSSGNLGVGITNPSTKLQVNGVIGFNDSNIRIGDNSVGSNNTTGVYNNFFGIVAGFANTSGCYNNFMGLYAGCGNLSGNHNNIFGSNAGKNNACGSANNFFGRDTGQSNTTGDFNNFIGYQAGCRNTTGKNNIFIGGYAGFNNTVGSYNNFFGPNAGRYSSGQQNNFFGLSAGFSNSSDHNNFFGSASGYNNSTGTHNQFFGLESGNQNTSGSFNHFYGQNSGRYNTVGNCNIYLGFSAGLNYINADSNTIIGSYSGTGSTTGGNNVIIGAGRNVPITNGSNQLVIGSGTQDWIIGNSSYNVGIGTTNPTAKLHIIGGTTAARTAPLEIARGSLLSVIESDVFEYDGVALYHTPNDTTNGHGRSVIPEVQYFKLNSDGTAINATTTGAASTAGGSWFGSTRRPSLISGYTYEFVYHCAYTRATTNSGLTFQFTASSGSITDIEAVVLPASGGQTGAYVQTGTGTTVTTTATANINSTTTGILTISGIVIPGANMKLDLQVFQASGGTTTPKKGSWYRFNCLGIGNTVGNIG